MSDLAIYEMRGPELKQLRKARGMSQTQLAHEVGVSQQTVAKWERGSNPRIRNNKALRNLLGDEKQETALQGALRHMLDEMIKRGELSDAKCLQVMAALSEQAA